MSRKRLPLSTVEWCEPKRWKGTCDVIHTSKIQLREDAEPIPNGSIKIKWSKNKLYERIFKGYYGEFYCFSVHVKMMFWNCRHVQRADTIMLKLTLFVFVY